MNTNSAVNVAVLTDTELVVRSLAGNSEAFGLIVARYQSLVCSLAYSATGSLGESEDLAQETFITAWKHLRHLREAAKLRAWLCGIARNRIRNFLRREGREPVHRAEIIDAEHESVAHEPIPAEHAISKEEAAILWRSLERLPEIYREPLVLFYREGESVERVASELDLSEDAVKQRLSRGRKMLAEEVTAFVEGALKQSGPGKAFTLSVLAALPLMTASAKAAVIAATAAKGSAVAKTAGLAGAFSAIASPIMIFLGTYFGYRLELQGAKSPRAREFVKKFYLILVSSMALMAIVVLLVLLFAKPLLRSYPQIFIGLFISLGVAYVMLTLQLAVWTAARQKLIRQEDAVDGTAGPLTASFETKPAFEYLSRRTLLGWPLVHIRLRAGLQRGPVKAWIALGDWAIGGLFACGGLAIAPISFGGAAVGLITFGGAAIGLLSMGGLSLGFLTIGGLALGWQSYGGLAVGWRAFGGCAIGWNGARGGLAVAREWASGGLAIAPHANDETAKFLFENSTFFKVAERVNPYLPLLTLFSLLPLFLQRHALKRRLETGDRAQS
jgi:RNA polymerase sigma factor (sigma-70 family)